MMKIVAIWIFKPVVIVLWLIHLDAAYAQGQPCPMGCNPTEINVRGYVLLLRKLYLLNAEK